MFGIVSNIDINTGDLTLVVRNLRRLNGQTVSVLVMLQYQPNIVFMIFTAGHSCHSSWTLEVVLVYLLFLERIYPTSHILDSISGLSYNRQFFKQKGCSVAR